MRPLPDIARVREVSLFPLDHGRRVPYGNQLETKVSERFEVVAICGEQFRILLDGSGCNEAIGGGCAAATRGIEQACRQFGCAPAYRLNSGTDHALDTQKFIRHERASHEFMPCHSAGGGEHA